MANQRDIVLRPGAASPRDIVLRELPAAAIRTTLIVLRAGHATPQTIVLYDPSATPGTPVTGALAVAFAVPAIAAAGSVTTPGPGTDGTHWFVLRMLGILPTD